MDSHMQHLADSTSVEGTSDGPVGVPGRWQPVGSPNRRVAEHAEPHAAEPHAAEAA